MSSLSAGSHISCSGSKPRPRLSFKALLVRADADQPRRIRWFLAGLVTTFGYAFIDLWLLATNASALRSGAFPRRLAYLGVVAGGVSASGLLAAPGIFGRVDAIDSAQWFVSASMYFGGFGWSILYTIWCLWFGRLPSSARVTLQAATAPRAA